MQYWGRHSNSCSQKRITFQPFPRSSADTRLSREIFLPIFLCQYSVLDFGVRFLAQLLQPCQKQPSTKMASRCSRNKKSGLPGSSLGCARHPVILFFRSRERNSSSVDFAPELLTAVMIPERQAFDTLSVTIRLAHSSTTLTHPRSKANMVRIFAASRGAGRLILNFKRPGAIG